MSTRTALIRRLKTGDSVAYRELMNWAGPQVLRWCRRLRLNDADAQDVFQSSFLAVFQNISSFTKHPNTGGFRAWLWTIVSRKAADVWRKEKPVLLGDAAALLQADLPPEPDLPDRNDGLWTACNVVRSNFTDTSWRAFWLTTVEGRSAQEVALELSLTPAAVRKAKSRVLSAIRSELADWLGSYLDAPAERGPNIERNCT